MKIVVFQAHKVSKFLFEFATKKITSLKVSLLVLNTSE